MYKEAELLRRSVVVSRGFLSHFEANLRCPPPPAAPQVAVGKTSGEKCDTGGIEGMERIATFKGA